MSPYDRATARLDEVRARLIAAVSDGQRFAAGMEGIRRSALEMVDIMRELVDGMSKEQGKCPTGDR